MNSLIDPSDLIKNPLRPCFLDCNSSDVYLGPKLGSGTSIVPVCNICDYAHVSGSGLVFVSRGLMSKHVKGIVVF